MELERIIDSQDLELVQDAFAALGELGFFRKYADRLSLDLIARFETISTATERTAEVEKISAIRAILLELDQESTRLAERMRDSIINKGTENEIKLDT